MDDNLRAIIGITIYLLPTIAIIIGGIYLCFRPGISIGNKLFIAFFVIVVLFAIRWLWLWIPLLIITLIYHRLRLRFLTTTGSGKTSVLTWDYRLRLKPAATIGDKEFALSTEVSLILVLVFIASMGLSIFLFPLIPHALLYLVLRSKPIARLWTPSLTRWFWGCTIFIFAYLCLSLPTPEFMWTVLEYIGNLVPVCGDVRRAREQGPSFALYYYTFVMALLYAPYISLAFVTIVCLFKKLFKKLSGQKGSA